MRTIVVAKYKEDVSWLSKLDGWNIVVLDKNGNMENPVGREAHSYLWFIVNNYENLQGEYVFCQGNPFDHCYNFLDVISHETRFGRTVTCDLKGFPDHVGLPLEEYIEAVGINTPEELSFIAGCQFKTTAEKIKAQPLELYTRALYLTTKDELSPFTFERLWPYILL